MWTYREEMEKAFQAEGTACAKMWRGDVAAWEACVKSKEPSVQAERERN